MRLIALAVVLGLAGCASTTTTQVSRNQFIIQTSAAPACGAAGAAKVASKMVAVETIRNGFERFVIVGQGGANNTTTTYMPPTQSYTSMTYGGGYARAQTNYYGGGTMVSGTHDAALAVVMMNRGERGFNDGVDAKKVLGADWEKLVKEGVNSCT